MHKLHPRPSEREPANEQHDAAVPEPGLFVGHGNNPKDFRIVGPHGPGGEQDLAHQEGKAQQERRNQIGEDNPPQQWRPVKD
jgi:uncharacterized protein YjlB